jgi:tripartite-type tricarboxylate transporter receptor subunit TctC
MPEAGFARVVFESWTALAMPAGAPAGVIERLYRECARVLSTEEATAWFGSVGNTPGAESPEATARIVLAEQQKWGAVIKAAGIRAER